LYLAIALTAIIVLVGATWYVLNQQPQTAKPSPSTTPTPSGSPTVPTSTFLLPPTARPSPYPSTNPTTTPYSSSAPTQTPTATPTPTSATSAPIPTPIPPTPTPTPTPITATFNFDTGIPTLTAYQPTPFDQTSNGLTAHFSSTADPPSHPAFSTQTTNSLASIAGVISSQNFSGNFLWPSAVNHDSLSINFNVNITSITLNFKTAELNDPGPGGTGSAIRITGYLNSNGNVVGTPVTIRGVESNDVYPEGTLLLNSVGQPFNLVVIDLPIPTGASGFIIDNIIVLAG
jgi:hypothetical protein